MEGWAPGGVCVSSYSGLGQAHCIAAASHATAARSRRRGAALDPARAQSRARPGVGAKVGTEGSSRKAYAPPARGVHRRAPGTLRPGRAVPGIHRLSLSQPHGGGGAQPRPGTQPRTRAWASCGRGQCWGLRGEARGGTRGSAQHSPFPRAEGGEAGARWRRGTAPSPRRGATKL